MSNDKLPAIGEVAFTNIDGLNIRYAKTGTRPGFPIFLTAPWPESIYSFHRLVPRLTDKYQLLLVDLPGFGRSESRPDVMAPEAMGDFIIKLLEHFGISRTHGVAPDIGTPAILFAAAKKPDLFESLVLGGAAILPDMAAGALKDLVYSPPGFLGAIGIDGVKPYLDHAAQLTPEPIIEDFKAASAGRRLEEATQFVRGYIPDGPKLVPLISHVKNPSLIIAGKNDAIVPPSNGEFLAAHLPNNRNVLLDADHRVWEEASEAYFKNLRAWFDGGYTEVIATI